MASLEERLDALEQEAASFVSSEDLDAVWIIWCGIMVFCECYDFSLFILHDVHRTRTRDDLARGDP